MATKRNNSKGTGFKGETIGTVMPKGTKFKKNANGTITPIFPKNGGKK